MAFRHELLTPKKLPRTVINGKRYYLTPSGEKYPSITTVIDKSLDKGDGLKKWQKRIGYKKAEKIKTQSANKGQSLHTLCEKYLLNTDNYLDDVLPFTIETFNNIKPLIDENINDIKGIEFPLYSNRLKIAGTTDLICNYNNELSIVDFKTARKTKREDWILGYFLQATLYSLCLYEIYGLEAKKIVLLVSVENSPSQVFIKDVKDYIKQAIYITKKYHIDNPPSII